MTRVTETRMRMCRLVSIAVASLVVVVSSGAAQIAGQALQRGVSVALPATHHATPLPAADQPGALIVAITRKGSVYLGVDPVPHKALTDRVRRKLAGSAEKTPYVKADARLPYATVSNVLDALRAAGVKAPTLLTAQRDPSDTMPVPPKGLKVQLDRPSPSASPAVIQILHSGQHRTVKLNGTNIPVEALSPRLKRLARPGHDNVAAVSAEDGLPFAAVVNVIDRCSSAGFRVALVDRHR